MKPKAKAGGTVPCPSCGKPAAYSTANRWRPFCSERCRLVDLGSWANESYRIPGKPQEDLGGGEDER